MKKYILSAMTVLVMVCGLFAAMPAAKANAISQTDVSGKLNSLMNQYVGKRGSWSFAGGVKVDSVKGSSFGWQQLRI